MSLYCPGGMTTQQCLDLWDAISFLKGHADSFCRLIGDEAEEQFEDDLITYEVSEEYYGESYRWPNGEWVRTTTLTNLNWQSGNDPVRELANTLSHEIGGHQGLGEYTEDPNAYHPISEFVGETCSEEA
jgi:hypothetical protein